MTVTFACGHTATVESTDTPVCHCGERRVSRVDAPPPRFHGVATGPYCDTKKEAE